MEIFLGFSEMVFSYFHIFGSIILIENDLSVHRI